MKEIIRIHLSNIAGPTVTADTTITLPQPVELLQATLCGNATDNGNLGAYSSIYELTRGGVNTVRGVNGATAVDGVLIAIWQQYHSAPVGNGDVRTEINNSVRLFNLKIPARVPLIFRIIAPTNTTVSGDLVIIARRA